MRSINRGISLRRLHLVKRHPRRIQLVLENIAQRHHTRTASLKQVGSVLRPSTPTSKQSNSHRRIRRRSPNPRRRYKHHPSHRSSPLRGRPNKLPTSNFILLSAITRHLAPPHSRTSRNLGAHPTRKEPPNKPV